MNWPVDRSGQGVLAPGHWFWLRAIAWMAGLFAFAILVMVASLELGDWLRLPDASNYYVAILTPVAGLGLYTIAVKLGERRTPEELALRQAPAYLFVGAVIGFAFMSLSLGALWLVGLNDIAGGHWQDWPRYLVFNSYISAVVEELGFRAILLRLLARMLGPVWGLVLSAILFALAHASHAPPVALGLLVIDGGLLLGILYTATGSLWTAIGAHLAYDFTEASLFGIGDKDGFLIVSPSNHYPAWLTGGAFGPDGSILSAIVALALIGGVVAARRSSILGGSFVATTEC